MKSAHLPHTRTCKYILVLNEFLRNICSSKFTMSIIPPKSSPIQRFI